jgi:hypothetical protein
MMAALPAVAAELAEDKPPKKPNPTVKKANLKGTRQAPKSTQAVRNKGGTIALDREKIRASIRRLKPTDDDNTATEGAKKKQRMTPKEPKEPKDPKAKIKFPTFAKGNKGTKATTGTKDAKAAKVAKPRGRPPGSKNKKTIAMNSVAREGAQIAQAVA